ncbi:hypothetical protein CTI14_64965, partial [Methylobacterium radiotolerans]
MLEPNPWRQFSPEVEGVVLENGLLFAPLWWVPGVVVCSTVQFAAGDGYCPACLGKQVLEPNPWRQFSPEVEGVVLENGLLF